MPLSRYRCPRCGGGLSRTYLYPRFAEDTFQAPPQRMPVLPICVAIVVVGFALAFIHVALAVVGVLGIAAWVGWRYNGALQCDHCAAYFVSGQFARGTSDVVPWRRKDAWNVVRRVALFVLAFLLVFMPVHCIETKLEAGCAKTCNALGLGSKTELFRLQCACVPKK